METASSYETLHTTTHKPAILMPVAALADQEDKDGEFSCDTAWLVAVPSLPHVLILAFIPNPSVLLDTVPK
jgi:hypothetical protein